MRAAMRTTALCLLLLFSGDARGASIIQTRPKGNSLPKPPPAPVAPPPVAPPPVAPPPVAPPSDPEPGLDFGSGVDSWLMGLDQFSFPAIPVEKHFYVKDLDIVTFSTCSYETLIDALRLRSSPARFQMSRPVTNHTHPLTVYLEVVLYAILDVKETDQTCVTCVWTFMSWLNENIAWDPSLHCGMDKITIPSDTLWKPDLIIEEVTEKGQASAAPYLSVYSDGLVELLSDQVVTSSCKMFVYRFPFDTQSCNLTFKSAIHSVAELSITAVMDPEKVSAWTREKMRTQYEWLFVDMTVTNMTVTSFEKEQDAIIYTINMKRCSVLYIVNFLFPVLFFLLLDLASFLMSDTGGEKLGFKITVLLAVTVMQLLLNDILPSSFNRIPLITVYCIGIFSLMLLSLLESILMVYLINKDSESEPTHGVKNKSLPKSDSSLPDEKDEVSLDLVVTELRDVRRVLSLIPRREAEDEAPSGSWARKTKTINRYFFIFYVFSVAVFLLSLFSVWIHQ